MWKSNLNMILVIYDIHFVLMLEYPPSLTRNATQIVRDAYDRWTKANDKARVYLLSNMSDILSKKHETMVTACQITDSLQKMLKGQNKKGETNVAYSKSFHPLKPSLNLHPLCLRKLRKRKEGRGRIVLQLLKAKERLR